MIADRGAACRHLGAEWSSKFSVLEDRALHFEIEQLVRVEPEQFPENLVGVFAMVRAPRQVRGVSSNCSGDGTMRNVVPLRATTSRT